MERTIIFIKIDNMIQIKEIMKEMKKNIWKIYINK